jgi:hypothetical protein
MKNILNELWKQTLVNSDDQQNLKNYEGLANSDVLQVPKISGLWSRRELLNKKASEERELLKSINKNQHFVQDIQEKSR